MRCLARSEGAGTSVERQPPIHACVVHAMQFGSRECRRARKRVSKSAAGAPASAAEGCHARPRGHRTHATPSDPDRGVPVTGVACLRPLAHLTRRGGSAAVVTAPTGDIQRRHADGFNRLDRDLRGDEHKRGVVDPIGHTVYAGDQPTEPEVSQRPGTC